MCEIGFKKQILDTYTFMVEHQMPVPPDLQKQENEIFNASKDAK
jgi:hypothetical protein